MQRQLRLWALGLIGALGMGSAAGCSQTKTGTGGELQKAEAKKPRTVEELLAPFPVVSQMQFRPMPELLVGTRGPTGCSAAPVNTQEPDRDFFTAPEFDQGDNNGRLFHTRFIVSDENHRSITLNYICWQPLNSSEMMAQLFFPRADTHTGEVTTDGKKIYVPHHPESGKGKTRVDAYHWEGDAHGNGRFVIEGTAPKLELPLPLS